MARTLDETRAAGEVLPDHAAWRDIHERPRVARIIEAVLEKHGMDLAIIALFGCALWGNDPEMQLLATGCVGAIGVLLAGAKILGRPP